MRQRIPWSATIETIPERSKEVGRILEKIFTERCGLPAEVRFSFTKAEKERRDDFDEEAALAALLASHVQDMGGGQEEMAGSRGQEEDHGDPGGGGAPAKDQKPGSRTFTKKTFGEKKTAGWKRRLPGRPERLWLRL